MKASVKQPNSCLENSMTHTHNAYPVSDKDIYGALIAFHIRTL